MGSIWYTFDSIGSTISMDAPHRWRGSVANAMFSIAARRRYYHQPISEPISSVCSLCRHDDGMVRATYGCFCVVTQSTGWWHSRSCGCLWTNINEPVLVDATHSGDRHEPCYERTVLAAVATTGHCDAVFDTAVRIGRVIDLLSNKWLIHDAHYMVMYIPKHIRQYQSPNRQYQWVAYTCISK